MNKKRKHDVFALAEVFDFLWRWRKQLISVAIASVIISAVASSELFITPMYNSTTVFYPSQNYSVSYSLLEFDKSDPKDMYRYGGKEIVEEYLQVLRSGRLGGKVTNRFNLMSHYGIDYADKDCYTKLWRMYNKNVTISRTEYNSIMVSVYDKNPKMASDIANSIVEFVDSVKYEMQLEMARKSLDIVSRKYEAKKIEVDTLKSLIRALGKKGIFNVGEQSQALTELVGKGFFKDANVKLLGENLAEYGGDRDALSGLLVWELSQLNDIKRKLDQCVADVDEHITYVFVIDKAYPSESKAYPIRSLIVLVSLLSSFLLACIILVFYERITDYRKDRMSI